MVETHSYRLSPLGPALQFGGGSSVISASSFCIRLAEVPRALDIRGVDFVSLRGSSLVAVAVELLLPEAALAPALPPFVLAPPRPRAGVLAAVVWLVEAVLLEEPELDVAATLELVALLPAPDAAAGVEDMMLFTVLLYGVS